MILTIFFLEISDAIFRVLKAVRTRLELVTSCVTGRHSNQLN